MNKTIIETCELLTCGTEILMGQIVNTNAAYLARQLTLLGISSQYQTTVGDNPGRLDAAIRTALSRSDCVIMTGGLGPTEDDISMAAAARVAGRPLQVHQPSVEAIRSYFKNIGKTPADNNFKQALMPEGATVMPNDNGTAPGAIVPVTLPSSTPETEAMERQGFIILLPGPPAENQLMFERYAAPFLKEHTAAHFNTSFIRLIGIGESDADTALKDLIDAQVDPTIAPYCSEGEVMFRVTQRARSADEPDRTGPLIQEVKERLGKYIYEIGERKLPEVVRDLLLEQKKSVGFAESCTAGLAAATFAETAGVSAVMKGGVVSYSNEVKEAILGVPKTMLEEHGAVSEEVAAAMAKGCRQALETDIAVGITGIAGPDGGSEAKPVGLVYIGVSDEKGEAVRKYNIRGDRNKVRRIASLYSFDMIRMRLLGRI